MALATAAPQIRRTTNCVWRRTSRTGVSGRRTRSRIAANAAVPISRVGWRKVVSGTEETRVLYGFNSLIGRTSMLPSRAGGIFEATWIASFKSLASIR